MVLVSVNNTCFLNGQVANAIFLKKDNGKYLLLIEDGHEGAIFEDK
ncbi:MAG: hypothetical protein QM528_04785 [Phycisphaerales bacterium]|nr:hypothetical protein [Phycisphaerales bacterium]